MPKSTKNPIFAVCSLLCAGVMLLLLACPAYTQNDSLSLGKIAYEQQNYQKALSYFDIALSQQPTNSITLYYRANTLVKLGLRTQALIDYQQAYKLTRSAKMKGYCKQAISALANNTGTYTYNQAINANEQTELRESLGTIQLQSAMDKVRIVDTGELLAQDATIKQQIQLAKLQQETAHNLQAMHDASYPDENGSKQSLYSDDEIQQYSQQRKEQEDLLKSSIQQITENQTAQAQQRAQSDEESATNLESQLSGSASPDGVKLDPLGTNLYIRNYEPTESSQSLPKPPVELTTK